MEELRNSRKKQQPEAPANGNKKETKRPREGDQGHRPPQRELPLPLGPKYARYANLNAPMYKILEEALNVELLSTRKRPSPKNANETMVCRFHENRGHTTKNCVVLKDELERLIRAGYL